MFGKAQELDENNLRAQTDGYVINYSNPLPDGAFTASFILPTMKNFLNRITY